MLGILFSILWMTWPIGVLLIITKKKRGYWWYTRKAFNSFWESYTSIGTNKVLHLKTRFSQALSIKFYRSDVYINSIGIFVKPHHLMNTKSGILIVYNSTDLSHYKAPQFAVLTSFEINNTTCIIKGITKKAIINTDFTIKFSELKPEHIEKLKECARL